MSRKFIDVEWNYFGIKQFYFLRRKQKEFLHAIRKLQN